MRKTNYEVLLWRKYWNWAHVQLKTVTSYVIKNKTKTMIPTETTELETKERHNAHVWTVLHRT